MIRNYFTTKVNAEKTMADNFYGIKAEFDNVDYTIRLYGNRKTEACAVVKVWYDADTSNEALVMIFADAREAGLKFREVVETALFTYC